MYTFVYVSKWWLQRIAVCCSVCYSVTHSRVIHIHLSFAVCVAVCCSVLQYVAVCCNVCRIVTHSYAYHVCVAVYVAVWLICIRVTYISVSEASAAGRSQVEIVCVCVCVCVYACMCVCVCARVCVRASAAGRRQVEILEKSVCYSICCIQRLRRWLMRILGCRVRTCAEGAMTFSKVSLVLDLLHTMAIGLTFTSSWAMQLSKVSLLNLAYAVYSQIVQTSW